MLMLFSICEKAFGRIGKKLEKNKLPKGGKDSGVECDTKTPGCETMCIDSFFPISPGCVTKLIIVVIKNCQELQIFKFNIGYSQKDIFLAIGDHSYRTANDYFCNLCQSRARKATQNKTRQEEINSSLGRK